MLRRLGQLRAAAPAAADRRRQRRALDHLAADWRARRRQDAGRRAWANRVANAGVFPIALIGETEHEVREVMIEGVSGVLRAHEPGKRPVWSPSRRRVEWPNGAYAQAFSAEDPESLRGPQFAAAWCDELAKWKRAEAAFDMLQFGLRLGDRPRQVITTTPRPTALIKRLVKDGARR